MSRTTYKIQPGKYLHMPTQSVITNHAHGDWRLLNSQGIELGKFGSKSDALRLLNRGDKTTPNHVAKEEAAETNPIPTARPAEVRPAPAERDGLPVNTPPDMTRLDYLTKVVQCVAPPPAGRMYVVLEIPAD